MKFPKFIVTGKPTHLTDFDLFEREQTAIGLASPTGDTLYPVIAAGDSPEAVMAAWRKARTPKQTAPTPREENPRVPLILMRDQWVKCDAEAVKAIKDAPLLREACPPGAWFGKPPYLFTDAAFSKDDRVELTSGIGASVHRYGDVRKNLHAFDGINPNPVWSGRDTKIKERRFVVVRFMLSGNLDAEYKRALHVEKPMKLALVTYDPVNRCCEFWYDVRDKKPAVVSKWFKACMACGADGRTSLAGFKAKIPNALCARPAAGALQAIREAGLDDRGILVGDTSYVLYFAGKSE